MEKFCIFCGSKPRGKSKEHVIPLWLIELTGEPNRTAYFGYDWNKGTQREFSFSSFTFPSCEECNSRFSKLEDNAKGILLKLTSGQVVNTNDISVFLDWLDKVRIGLWLGFYYLNKNVCNITPQFHIETRVGLNDRMVAIYRSDFDSKRLQFIGPDSPLFQYLPSCFTLAINGLYFFNLSKEFLFSRRVGFPYPAEQKLLDVSGATRLKMTSGKDRIMSPLIRTQMLSPSLELYQPIIRTDAKVKFSELYEKQYVKEHCLDWNSGLGKIFIMDQGKARVIPDSENIILDLNKKYNDEKLFLSLARQTFKFHSYLIDITASIEELPKETQRKIRAQVASAKRLNQAIMKVTDRKHIT